MRVLAFAEGEAARAAQEAGADYIGDDEVIKQIQDGWLEFDATVATPEMMGKIGKSGPGQDPGHAGPDAKPEGWHRRPRRRPAAGDQGTEGRPGGVPHRPDG